MTKNQRSLYQCFHARCQGKRIICAKEHPLSTVFKDNALDILRLQRGDALVFTICQSCQDYDEMGPPIEKEDRGWIHDANKGL